jgi:DNA-binding transcriptional LysR family regulator
MNDLSRFDLNLLLLFEALMQERSVSGAAKRLRLGQPATSAALGRLRAAVGDELFVRTGRAMRPTVKACELAVPFGQALAEVRAALNRPGSFDPARSNATFTLAHTDYTALVTLPAQLAPLRAIAPGVTLQVVGYEKSEVFSSLDRNQIDVAIGVFDNVPARFNTQVLFEESFVGVASVDHPILKRKTITPEQFAGYPHALVTVRRDARGFIDKRLAELGLSRRVAMTTPYIFALGAALHGTDLVATLPRRAAEKLSSQGLRQFELPFSTDPWSVTMMWNAASELDTALAWLRESLLRSTNENRSAANECGKLNGAVKRKIHR